MDEWHIIFGPSRFPPAPKHPSRTPPIITASKEKTRSKRRASVSTLKIAENFRSSDSQTPDGGATCQYEPIARSRRASCSNCASIVSEESTLRWRQQQHPRELEVRLDGGYSFHTKERNRSLAWLACWPELDGGKGLKWEAHGDEARNVRAPSALVKGSSTRGSKTRLLAMVCTSIRHGPRKEERETDGSPYPGDSKTR